MGDGLRVVEWRPFRPGSADFPAHAVSRVRNGSSEQQCDSEWLCARVGVCGVVKVRLAVSIAVGGRDTDDVCVPQRDTVHFHFRANVAFGGADADANPESV